MVWKRLRLPALLVAVSGALGVVARTPLVTEHDLRADEAVGTLRSPVLTAIADGLDIAFRPLAGIMIIAALAVVLAAMGRARTAVLVTAMVTIGWTTGSVLKRIIARPRPPLSGQLLHMTGHDSFPSGHVTLTLSLVIAACFLAAGTRRFRLVVCVGAVLVAAQAFARVYLGVHYPTDVIGALPAAAAGTSAVIALRDGVGGRFGRAPLSAAPPGRRRRRGSRDAGDDA
ncbi:phosphatase PAP2 family protein [Microtetraspora niveoalba]|uniref:phosphatase PAP2 family protein n=1 Tax=Microtetraspora niveoalba TaxID=46175 RepID=UPI000830F77F|nr:phosphatase PAP2 family protein [Microtetraspora niveoalba]